MNRITTLGLLLLFSILVLTPLPGQSIQFLPLDQVKPGMVGVGKTVFRGVQVEEFGLEVLGVLENISPKQNLILARLTGDKVEQTGVFAGMSGSPAYVDGKLIGAVAFAFAFAKEPIAGITPIQEMIDIFQRQPGSVQLLSGREVPSSLTVAGSLGEFLSLIQPNQERLAFEVPGLGMTRQMMPIATPLSFTGVSPHTLDVFAPTFRSLGFLPLAGVGSGRADFGEPTLEPGSTLAVQLVRGDMEISAAGTVTHVAGNNVYAFGHPFLGAGFTDIPMSKGAVVAVIPSLSNSQKVAASGESIGSIRQDRATGVLGLKGETAKLLPVHLKLYTSRNAEMEFRYEVVIDPLLTPLLTTLAVFNSISSSERTVGSLTLRVNSTVSLKGKPEVRFENSVSDLTNSPALAAVSAAVPIHFLLTSGFEDLDLEEVEVSIRAVEQTRKAIVDRVWVDRGEARPGEEVNVTVFLRKPNGETVSEEFPIKIPSQLSPGPLGILVGEGQSVSRLDAESGQAGFVPETSRQLIRAINNLKKNDRLYIRLFRNSPGVVLGGVGLPELPPSLLELYNSSRSSGVASAIDKVIYVEHELPPTEYVLEGSKIVQIQVKSS